MFSRKFSNAPQNIQIKVQEESLKASSRISVEKKLATFFLVVGQNASNRHAQERFQQSGSTISK